ncbi:protein C3orf33 homolog isoform X1 [Alosa alosa]|uniref:protein C3orf33 homolog isoform X1 n=1 Tax=Alosa alosa TaxID=278164 RepID=UPI0020150F2B|nr:protein C3orf33 homolog isoform X1 [Alosa alosa]
MKENISIRYRSWLSSLCSVVAYRGNYETAHHIIGCTLTMECCLFPAECEHWISYRGHCHFRKEHQTEIPSRFIKRNVGLRGRVCSITDKGLEVEHIPIYVPVLSPLLMKYQAGAPLQVRLAGVELTPEGWDWLRRQLRPAETVWLKLIRKEGDSLDCFVSRGQGFLLGTSLNEQVLQQGLARSTPILGLDHRSRVYWRLHKRLLKAELKAERKGRGLWREDDLRERVSAVVRENIVVKGVKRLLSLISGTKEQ